MVGAVAAMSLLGAEAVAGPADHYSLGLEGLYDDYQEPADGASVRIRSYYGSLTGNYSHDWGKFFGALDGRVSYGTSDYKSISGSATGIPEWELDGRIRGGYSFGNFSPYVGIGTRYYWDEFKGTTTVDSSGQVASGYDRKITQIYIPLGATYVFMPWEGVSVSPNLEYDQLVWGQVSSRLGTIPGLQNVINYQHSGWGLRGSIMAGWSGWGGGTWQAGPFFRYWDISDSDVSTAGAFTGLEPQNSRMQTGVTLRYLW